MTTFVNPFTGITHAKASLGGDWMNPGKGIIELDTCKMIISKNPKTLGDHMFIANFKVWEWAGVDVLQPGMARSWTLNMKKPQSLGDVKLFVCACLGVTETRFEAMPPEEGQQLSAAVISEAQPMKGQILALECYHVKTQGPQPFTKHVWSTGTEADIAKVQAAKLKAAAA